MILRLIRRGALAAALVIGLEAAYAYLRPAPDLPQFDPSGDFGDPGKPLLRVAVMGDSSVTAPGVGRPEEIWVSRLARWMAEHRSVQVRSFAVGGSRARDLVETQMTDAIAFRPDLVLVSVGANDVLKGVTARRFEVSLDRLIGELAATGALVVQSGVGDLGSIPRLHPPLRSIVSRRAMIFDEVHWRVAARHGTAVIHQRSDDPELWYRDRGLFSADLFHVSPAGHARWAETAWRTIQPLLARVGG